MRKNIKLYNVVFPVWLLIIFPISWLLIIPANFIVDSLVILIGLYILKIDRKKEFYKRTILWVFLFGFLSDIVGSIILLLTQFIFQDGMGYEYICGPVAENPFDNIYSLLYVVFAIVVSGGLIYVFNRFISFRIVLDKKIKRFMSLFLAILTAPYMFLIPTSTFYGGSSENFVNHFVPSEYIFVEMYEKEDGYEKDFNQAEGMKQQSYLLSHRLRQGIKTAKKVRKEFGAEPLYKAIFSTNEVESKRLDAIPIWSEENYLYFEWKGKTYRINEECSEEIISEIESIKTGGQ